MKHIRAIVDLWLELCLRIGYGFIYCCSSSTLRQQYRRLSRKNVVLYFLMQRVLRINSHVPWFAHWSSVVTNIDRIKLVSHPPFPGYSPGQYIQATNGIHFGPNVILAPGVKIISSNHEPNNYMKHLPSEPIVIGANCWIGANAVILPGVRLGDHVIVGAGAVVTKNFPANCIVAGVPAKIIKHLLEYSEVVLNGCERISE
jgi:hypothetical protein